MRALDRSSLASRVAKYLDDKQREVDEASEEERQALAKSKWTNSRRTATMKKVEKTLTGMSGLRERCMFCQDSRGTDIEHFWPKAVYPERTFRWPNLLLACTGCNRAKGDRFPRAEDGTPLLIDPTAEDPWDHLVFDRLTSSITARWFATGEESPRGVETLKTIEPLRYQAVDRGRRKAVRELEKLTEAALVSGVLDELNEALKENEYGLADWFILREGSEEPPFSTVRSSRPDLWPLLVNTVRRRRVGSSG